MGVVPYQHKCLNYVRYHCLEKELSCKLLAPYEVVDKDV